VLGALAPAATGGSPGTVPHLDHVVVVVFENKERAAVLGSGEAPAFDSYARRYADLSSYYALAHPSLPDYLALVSGSTHGITTDCTRCSVAGPSIGTLLTRAGRSWGAYAEGYPDASGFAKKHLPFLYFAGGQAHIHSLAAFRPSRPPAFSFVVPDLCNDMHDCSVGTGDRWLARFLPPLLRLPRTAVFVVFDEGSSDAGGGGHVAALAVGTAIGSHVVDAQRAGHLVLLRTVEDALGLPHLPGTGRVRPLAGIWR
jgi:hypothetical protein